MQIEPCQRLREARKTMGLTLEGFGDVMGVSNQAVHTWESGRTPISMKNARSIEVCHGISAKWLLEGKGEMFVKKLDIEPVKNPILIAFVPLLPSAGPGTDIANDPDVQRWIPFDPEWFNKRIAISPKHLFLTEIDGDSMVPTLYPNDLVMIDKSAPSLGFRDGIWVFNLDDAIHIKRVQYKGQNKFQANSDNPSYTPFTLKEPVHFIGRMVWSDKRW